MVPNPNSGRAYAFINCTKPKSDVEWIANDIRGMFAQEIPLLERMTLKVNRGLTFLSARGRMVEAKSELLKVVRDAEARCALFTKREEDELIKPVRACDPAMALVEPQGPMAIDARVFASIRRRAASDLYAIRASLPNTPNKTVADELAAIVNQMYQSPLYSEGERFWGIIAYLDEGSFTVPIKSLIDGPVSEFDSLLLRAINAGKGAANVEERGAFAGKDGREYSFEKQGDDLIICKKRAYVLRE